MRARNLAAVAMLAAGGAASGMACGSSDGDTPALDASFDGATTGGDGEGADSGELADVAASGDSATDGGRACGPGLTLCGTDCVQTRTSMQSCGACGAACTATAPSTAECVVGECIVTLTTSMPGAVTDLALNATHVYWTSGVANTIARVPTAGGVPETLVNGVAPAAAIALDATHMYWIAGSDIWQALLDGGSPGKVNSYVINSSIADLAINATTAFYPTGYGAFSLPLAGADAGKTVVTGLVNSAQRVLADDNYLYVTEYGTPIHRAPLDGGPATALTVSTGMPQSGLAMTATNLYWGTGSTVQSAPIDGGAATKVADVILFGIATDGVSLYGFTGAGAIVKIPIATGKPETLAFRNTPNFYNIHDIAVDATSVYWTETVGTTGRLMKVTPK